MAVQLVLLALQDAAEQGILGDEDIIRQDRLEAFLSRSGREFYKLPAQASRNIVLERRRGGGEEVPAATRIPESIKSTDKSVEIGVSRAGAEVFALSWA